MKKRNLIAEFYTLESLSLYLWAACHPEPPIIPMDVLRAFMYRLADGKRHTFYIEDYVLICVPGHYTLLKKVI